MNNLEFNISPLSNNLNEDLKNKINNKTKPLGSLGLLEKIAYKIGRIQESLNPSLVKPTIILVGSDHDICEEGVSPCPREITWQQMENFANKGGGIGLFTQHYGLDLLVVDAGVDYDFKGNKNIIDCKIRRASRNFLHQAAMTEQECKKAILNGANIVDDLHAKGTNIIAFGEMGIGNTSPASALMSVICNISIESCVGPGSGLDDSGLNNKRKVLHDAIQKHGVNHTPLEILSIYGGLEIATIAGAMLRAAEKKMIIINDGFIISSALLAAQNINPNVLDYVLFAHKSNEGGHKLMLDYLNAQAILDLDLRLGEGTGAAIAYPIISGAVAMLNNMTSFESACITDTTNNGHTIL